MYWGSPPGCLTSTANQHTQYRTHSSFSFHPTCNHLDFTPNLLFLFLVLLSALSLILLSPPHPTSLLWIFPPQPLQLFLSIPTATTLIKPSLFLFWVFSFLFFKKPPQQEEISGGDGMLHILIGMWVTWVYACQNLSNCIRSVHCTLCKLFLKFFKKEKKNQTQTELYFHVSLKVV